MLGYRDRRAHTSLRRLLQRSLKNRSYSWHGGEFTIASTYDDEAQVRIWQPNDTTSKVLRGHASFVYSVSTNRDGSIAASGSWDGTARIWNAQTGQQLFELPHPEGVHAVALDPEGHRLVTVSRGQELRLWDATTGQLLATNRHYDGEDFGPNFFFCRAPTIVSFFNWASSAFSVGSKLTVTS